MLKKSLLIIVGLLTLLVLFVFFFVNNENVDERLSNKVITHQTIQNHLKNEKFVLFVLSTGCPACNSEIGEIKKDIDYCKANNIDYLVLFDELHSSKTDKEISDFRTRNNFQEDLHLIDASKYKENIKIIDSKRRLKDFLAHFVPSIDEIPLGYPQYFYFKNGKFTGFSFYELKENAGKLLGINQ